MVKILSISIIMTFLISCGVKKPPAPRYTLPDSALSASPTPTPTPSPTATPVPSPTPKKKKKK